MMETPVNKPVGLVKRDVRYKKQQHIGQGAFGVVYQAFEVGQKAIGVLGKCVAVKQMKSRESMGVPQDAYREMKILKELSKLPNENIVRLERAYRLADPDGTSSLNLVYTYAEHDLAEIIRYHRAKSMPVDRKMIKSIMFQILQGVAFLHENWIMHRDIKPANILIQDVGDGPTPSASPAEVGRVLIADFGLARIFQSPLRSLAMDGDVVTIWYRAPELLLGSKHYTRAIDIWAIGCIFAELFLTRALFPGIDVNQKGAIQVDQLEKIFAVLGKPTPKQWPDIIYCSFFETIKDWNRNEFKFRLHEVCGIDKNSVEFDLLNRMLLYDPNQRITAAQALEHPYFKCPPAPSPNIFITSKNTKINYPTRSQRVAQAAQAHAANANNLPVAWGNDAAADASRQAKRMKI